MAGRKLVEPPAKWSEEAFVAKVKVTSSDESSDENEFVKCILQVTKSKIWATPVDRKISEIKIPGWTHCRGSFDQDVVLVEITGKLESTDGDINYFGRVVENIKQWVCFENTEIVCVADKVKLGLMIPLDRRIPKIWVGCKNKKHLVEYRSDGGVEKLHALVRHCDPDQVFVVRYDYWQENKPCPKGTVVGTKPLGLHLKTATELLNITYGVHKTKTIKSEYEVEAIVSNFKKMQNEVNAKDKTNLLCFTIDPPNSKDMDDALSLQHKPGEDICIVGVHIADVSLFIKHGSEGVTQEINGCSLNSDAFMKALSFYPNTGETISMLPNILAENYLSLLPHECRHVVSVYFTICISTGEIVCHSVSREIIKSKKKFTYNEAEKLISGTSPPGDNDLKTALTLLHKLALKLRSCRLNEAGLTKEIEDWHEPKSKLLVREFMILTNALVAKILKEKYGNKTPLCIQQPPIKKKFSNFRMRFDNLNSLSLKCSDNSVVSTELEMNRFPILKSVWRQISMFVKNGQIENAHIYLCFESACPILIPLSIAYRQIKERTKYSIFADCEESSIHFDLNLDQYAHFTSPIRRYMDIVVHRLLLAHENLSSETLNYSEETLRNICDHCNRANVTQNEYNNAMCSLQCATIWKREPWVTEVVIVDITSTEMKLEYPKLERHIQTLKRLKFRLLQLANNPSFNKREKKVSLKWTKRIYHYNHRPAEAGKFKKEIDLSESNHVVTLAKEYWCEILKRINCHDGGDRLREIIINVNRSVMNKPLVDISCELNERFGSTDDKIENDIKYRCCDVNINANLLCGSTIAVQIGCKLSRGIISPSIQLVKFTKSFSICLEHQRDPFLQFCLPANQSVENKRKFFNCLSYQLHWLPLVNMAAAYNSVNCKDTSVRIADVKVIWEKKFNNIFATFSLSKKFITERQIWFNRSFPELDNITEANLKRFKRIDHFCIEVPVKTADGENHWFWVAHCVSVEVIEDTKMGAFKFCCLWSSVHPTKVEPPSNIFKEPLKCILELIPTPLPERRMQEMLFNLHTASDLAQTIALGCPREQSSKHVTSWEIGIIGKNLNSGQVKAITHAFNSQFSRIWGPPGTGKTVTAVELACCFVRKNKTNAKRSKVVFCAPSNKAVNVVGKIFVDKKKNELNVLRIYARSTERNLYPLPFDPTPKANDNADPILNCITMHFRIHDTTGGNPYAKEVVEIYSKLDRIRLALENGKTAPKDTFELLEDYKKAVEKAEKWEIEQADILLMTCIVASKTRLQLVAEGKESSYTVEQLIIDECGMCTEPETLVPITATLCRQVVFVGDHKQLAPIVLSTQLKELGMGRSMFERYATPKDMLVEQYRMHESLMAFPSKTFYEKKLKLGNPQRQSLPSSFSFWPGGSDNPQAFLHCIGKEEKTVVATEESSEMSCKNETEAYYAVTILKRLIQKCNVKPSDVVFVSPYRAQLKLLQAKLDKMGEAMKSVETRTIVKSQGDEWDYVILSTVRSVEEDVIDAMPTLSWETKQLGSVADPHQINVALTRPRLGLFIIGNQHLLKVNKVWKSWLDNNNRFVCNAEEFCNRM